ncbi:MAG: HAMP domain-containing histidine kinase [Gammaproteobacteria bacterium]|nr:HAMP domain-containing histidine kinase [Gammaproteobacteria bacterium]
MHALLPAFTASTRLNLQRLVLLRAVLNGGELVALIVATTALGILLPVAAMSAVVLAHVLLNLYTAWRLRRPSPVRERELYVQLALDILAFGALLYLSGGATNPFSFLLLLPLTVSAAALPQRYSYATAGLAIGGYSLLMLFYRPLPQPSAHGFHMHVVGMWIGFVLSAALIAYFVTRMGIALREHQQRLAHARERALRDERLLALGTLAAGAAHELGTPLATMAVVTDELARECADDARLGRRLAIVRAQIDRCKQVLSGLSEQAGEARAESGRKLGLRAYLDALIEQWHRRRPEVRHQVDWTGAQGAGPWIVVDRTLDQALYNLLDNAADASPDSVEIVAGWDEDTLRIKVCDRGPGFRPEDLARAGQAFFTTKDGGQGLGLYLALATVTRYGGSLDMHNRGSGGACVHLTLPLARIRVDADE